MRFDSIVDLTGALELVSVIQAETCCIIYRVTIKEIDTFNVM